MEQKTGDILFATDLSVNMHKVFEQAATMAINYGAKVTILHVLVANPEAQRHLKSIFSDEEYQSIKREHQERAQKVLTGKNTEARKIQQALAKVFFEQERQLNLSDSETFINSILIAEGVSIADEIYDIASDRGCQCIVMGWEKHGFLSGALGDNILKKILNRSKIPVLVVPFSE